MLYIDDVIVATGFIFRGELFMRQHNIGPTWFSSGNGGRVVDLNEVRDIWLKHEKDIQLIKPVTSKSKAETVICKTTV